MQAQLHILQLKLSNRDAQILGERQKREEVVAQIQKVADNNRALAKHNTRLLEQVDRLKSENELAVHQLNTRTAAYKAREAEAAADIRRLQDLLVVSRSRISELEAKLILQLEAKQAAGLVPHHHVAQQGTQPVQGQGTANSCRTNTSKWAASVLEEVTQLPQDSFIVCADSVNSTVQQGSPQPCLPTVATASDKEQVCPQDICAHSADSTKQHQPTQPVADLEDSADSCTASQQQRRPTQDSFLVCADMPSPASQSSSVQQEQRVPPLISLTKTVRFLAHKGFISFPQPLQPACGRGPVGGGAPTARPPSPGSGATESQASNHPDGSAPAPVARVRTGSNAAVAVGQRRLPEGIASLVIGDAAGDRESATVPPAQHVPSGSESEPETVFHPDGSFAELSSVTAGCETVSRYSSRSRRRVSYALPNLRSKLRQGDSFTFGDPAAVPSKPHARTKPKPRYRQPAPSAYLSIPVSLEEDPASWR